MKELPFMPIHHKSSHASLNVGTGHRCTADLFNMNVIMRNTGHTKIKVKVDLTFCREISHGER